MPLPKGKLLALVAVFAAVGIAAGTGAFTTVTAERTATVGVTGDADALLAIDEADTKNGDEYVEDGDQLQIDMAGDEGASGINPNATTAAHDVIEITNQGSQPVYVSLQREGENSNAVTFAVDETLSATATNENLPSSVAIPGSDGAVPITTSVQGTSKAVAYELNAGESVEVGIYADTTDGNPFDAAYAGDSSLTNDTNLLEDVTIIAANQTGTIQSEASGSPTVVETSDGT